MKFIIRVLTSIVLLTLVSMGITAFASELPTDFAKSVGANENLITELDKACKTTKHYEHCFGIGLSISNAETQMGNDNSSHGYFGRVASKDKTAYGFAGTYSRMYSIPSKYNEGGMFYGYDSNNPAPTHYCMSEESSNSKGHCPNGRDSFNKIYSKYKEQVLGDNQPQDERTPIVKKGAPKNITIKTICREQTLEIQEGEYLKITYLGKLRIRIKNLRKGDSVQVCRDIK